MIYSRDRAYEAAVEVAILVVVVIGLGGRRGSRLEPG